MSLPLRIHRMVVDTEYGESSYNFAGGLNVISGSYGTGKSSMLELIKFAFGGANAKLMPTVAQTVRSVEIDVTVGVHRLYLRRIVNQNLVSVADADGSLEKWTATRGKLPSAGIRLLELIGFPVTRLSKQSGSDPVTFFDLYRYVYLPQSDINSSVAGHSDTFLNRKRKAVFEVAYGLADERLRQLELQAGDLASERDKIIVDANAVRRFLIEAGAPEDDILDANESQARQMLAEAEMRLEEARTTAITAVSGDQELLRQRISELRTRNADYEAAYTTATSAVERGRALVAQLDLDSQRVTRELQAVESLSGLEFVSCPRCLQQLEEREVPQGHCPLCLQDQTSSSRMHDGSVEMARISAQREETLFLLKEDEDQRAHIANELYRLRAELNEAAGELERQADPRRLMPSIDLASEAASERERQRARIRDIERYRDLWQQHHRQEEEVARLKKLIEANEREQAEVRRTLESNRLRVVELGEAFDEEIRAFEFAGYETAGIDTRTYLPIINGHTFDELSVSGARKTLANVAYYLANLTYSLSNPAILLPCLLILDSPRTSLGNTAEDVAAGQRIYYRMGVLATAYPQCQIIVADNGLPPMDNKERRAMNEIEFDYERPFLHLVPHPGRENVETIGGADRNR